ncbi:hypothetical protein [Catellatospora sichuanensis]|uniref:hypothetical protein n=1 Tax=Catellatospora sichuanensis TaxID=1969805 RepID=UPI001182EAD0|nr:hypothetical protein [Catellatospora sichuanensis]
MTEPSFEPPPASRRRTLAVVLSAAGVAVALLLGVVLVPRWLGDTAATEAPPAAAAFTTPDATGPAETTAAPAGSPPAEPSTSPSTSPTPARAATPTPRPKSSPRTSPKPAGVPSPACSPNSSINATTPKRDWTITFMADGNDGSPPQFCGQRRRVWWVVYVPGPDPERLYLYDSGVSYLDATHLTWTTKLAVHECAGSWYYGRGSTVLPQTIAMSDRSTVFGHDKVGWDDDGNPCN